MLSVDQMQRCVRRVFLAPLRCVWGEPNRHFISESCLHAMTTSRQPEAGACPYKCLIVASLQDVTTCSALVIYVPTKSYYGRGSQKWTSARRPRRKRRGRISSRQDSGGEKCSLYTKKYYKPLARKSGQGVRSLKTSTTPTAMRKMRAG